MYEYKILKLKSPISEEQLNEFGKDGWALVTIVSSDYYLASTFFTYLGRVKKDDVSWADEAYSTLRQHALEATP